MLVQKQAIEKTAKMNNVYRILNNIQTHLITWGNPFDCDGQDVIICITGNPGMPDFYIEFASELYRSTGLPICIIGHAGGEEVPIAMSNVLTNQEHLFNLEGQLAHKLDLINNNIDKKSKLHFVGHSIGAWLTLELLHKNENLIGRISSINLLFPTIQRMAESRNGIFLNNVIRKFNGLLLLLIALINLLPESIRRVLANLYLKFNSLPTNYCKILLKFIKPKVIEKVLFMAYDEMDKVTTLNNEAIDKVKHITNVIYSNRDDWVPVTFMEDLKQFQPLLQIREVSINHAFVLKSSERVAEMVADFIKTNTL